MIFYFSIFLIFIIFGIISIIKTTDIFEKEIRYDNVCSLNERCIVNLNINKKLEGPIYIYYVITDFF